jgi:DNA-binding transcriptional LysR family regulator
MNDRRQPDGNRPQWKPVDSLDDVPPLESLQALVTFAETGGVAAAAQALDVPQPTVSRRLQVFQRPDESGEAILVRRGRNLRLSEKGRVALAAVRDLVAQYAQFDRFLRGKQANVQIVRLGTGQFGARHYLPGALAGLRRRGVLCEVRAETVRGQERILGVAEGRYDLALVTHDAQQVQTILSASANRRVQLLVEPLAAHAFCVIAPRGSKLATELRARSESRSAPIELLSRFDLVGLDRQSGIRTQLEAEFHKLRVPLRFVDEASVGGWAAAKEYARHGLGAAIVPLPELDPADFQDFAIRKLPERFRVTDYLVQRPTSPGSHKPAVVRALREAVGAKIKEVRERWSSLA